MTRADSYPSRVGGETTILPRKDPVIHDAKDRAMGPLSEEQIASFEHFGFVALDGFLDQDEAAALLSEAERLREAGLDGTAPEIVTEPESGEVRSVFAVHRTSQVFGRLARDPRLVGVATQILGGPVYIHQSRINYKPAFRGREFYWHSDFETWHVEDGMPRMRAVSLSLNLVGSRAHNGPLMLVPESHRHFVSCPGRTPERNFERSLRRQEYGVPAPEALEKLVQRGGIVAPLGGPGSAILFDSNCMHGSNGNITPWPRSSVFFVYNSVENALGPPYSGQAARPEHIASRDFTPLNPMSRSICAEAAGP